MLITKANDNCKPVKRTTRKQQNIDNVVVKYIIEQMGKHPAQFIPIINEIISENNPDSRAIVKSVSEGLMKAIITQKEFTNAVHQRILDMIGDITTGQVMDIVNKQRLSLSEDSKKFLENVAKSTMIDLCEKYFEVKRKDIDNILKEYFKTINSYIGKEFDKKVEEFKKNRKSKGDCVDINVPSEIKDDVIKYVEFLQSKK